MDCLARSAFSQIFSLVHSGGKGGLEAAVSISFLFCVASISENKQLLCKCYVSRILFECCSQIIKEPYTVRLWRWHSSVR